LLRLRLDRQCALLRQKPQGAALNVAEALRAGFLLHDERATTTGSDLWANVGELPAKLEQCGGDTGDDPQLKLPGALAAASSPVSEKEAR
jgi:hypothetical protein